MNRDLKNLAKEILRLQKEIAERGGFDHTRELLECPQCGLMEDVTFAGELISCREDSLGTDTGLRFVKLPNLNKWRCPACATELTSVDL